MTATHYSSVYATGANNNTFGRSFASELLKLRHRTLSLNVIVFAILLIGAPSASAFFSRSEAEGFALSVQDAVGGFQLYLLLAIIIGTLAVTGEYASNTMRTTVLATPRRLVGLLAKVLAVALYTALATIAIITVAFLIIFIIAGGNSSLDGNDVLILVTLLGLNVLTAVMATGLGYILRSTAGGISMMIAFIFLLPLVTLIFAKFDTFRYYVPPNLPLVLMDTALQANQGMPVSDDMLVYPPLVAFLIFGGYTLIVTVLGYLRYEKSDV
ncbi:ABC transporter permease subunit [Arcanobacterium phocisimile]|uniref:ABC transporter permease subunit n=1 Tax=Arcanobacterium phocisimile TaxID=1302235 RepID=A0ABX7IIM3_9ACTO|nr:ABC transporter permease subunit [Arcanobacterium phocisimile]QRV01955.1 ABC transporter permease subunit [Arcanobacterium phocisimile]